MIALVLRGLAERRLRSVLTGLAIVLGVAMIAGTYVQTDQIKQAFNDITKTGMAGVDVVVTPREAFQSDAQQSLPPFSAAYVQRIAGVPGVRRAEGNLYESGSLVVGGKRVGSDFAPSIVVSDASAPFDPNRYRSGGKPQPGEIAVNRKLAADEHLRVGQTVRVATRSGVQRVRLSGIFDYGDVSSVGGATLIVAPIDDVQRWYDLVGQVTSVSVAAEPGASASALARVIRAKLPPALTVRTGDQEAKQTADRVNDQLGSFLTPMLMSLAGAALLVGAFIIFNTFSITVAQRVREIALLRSIGATRRQVVAAVTGEALVIGVIASVIGLFGGVAIARGLGALFDAAGFGIPRTGVIMEPRTVIVSLTVGIVVTVVAALVPAVRATRVPPVAAMTGAPQASARAKRWAPWVAGGVSALGLAALLMGLFSDGPATTRVSGMAGGAVLLFVGVALSARWFVRPVAAAVGLPIEKLFKVPGHIARENAMRNPSRTAATSAALMVGLGLVVFVAVFAAGLKASMNTSMDELVTADYVIKAQGYEPLPAGAAKRIAATPGVQTSVEVFTDAVEVDRSKPKGQTDVLQGIDPRTLPAVYRFKWVDGSDRLLRQMSSVDALMDEQFAKAHGLKVGDVATLRTPSGNSSYVRVIGEYDDPQLLNGIIVTDGAFRELSGVRDPFFYIVKAVPGMAPATVHAALDHTMKAFPAAEVKSNAEYRKELEGQVDTMVNMLYALLGMSVVISLFGIANSLFLSIHERTREIGLLRAVGATRPQVRRVVRYESVITAVLGGVLGIAVGLLFGWLITQALADLGFEFAVPGAQLVAFLVLAIAVGVVGAIAPARRGARIDVLEALHYE